MVKGLFMAENEDGDVMLTPIFQFLDYSKISDIWSIWMDSSSSEYKYKVMSLTLDKNKKGKSISSLIDS